jgi:hypothetical protein
MKYILSILLVCSTSAFACNYKLKIKKINGVNIDNKVFVKLISSALETRGYYPGIGKYTVKSFISLTQDHHRPELYQSKASLSLYKSDIMENYVHGLGDQKKSKIKAMTVNQYSKSIKAAISNLPFCNQ